MNRDSREFARALGVFVMCLGGGVVAVLGKPGVVPALALLLIGWGIVTWGLDR